MSSEIPVKEAVNKLQNFTSFSLLANKDVSFQRERKEKLQVSIMYSFIVLTGCICSQKTFCIKLFEIIRLPIVDDTTALVSLHLLIDLPTYRLHWICC